MIIAELWQPIWPAALGLWLLASAFVLWPALARRRPVATADEEAGAKVKAQTTQPGDHAEPDRRAFILPCTLAGLLGLSMLGLYNLLGNQGWDQAEASRSADQARLVSPSGSADPDAAIEPGAAASGVSQAQIEAMVARLAQRLQQQPDDAAGWRMLARSYETLGRLDEAVKAYEQWTRHAKPDADGLTDYAVTLGMSQGQTLTGQPEALIDEALRINPKHIQALALSGGAAYEQGDFAKAVERWKALLAQVPPEAEMRSTIELNLKKAQERLAQGR